MTRWKNFPWILKLARSARKPAGTRVEFWTLWRLYLEFQWKDDAIVFKFRRRTREHAREMAFQALSIVLKKKVEFAPFCFSRAQRDRERKVANETIRPQRRVQARNIFFCDRAKDEKVTKGVRDLWTLKVGKTRSRTHTYIDTRATDTHTHTHTDTELFGLYKYINI